MNPREIRSLKNKLRKLSRRMKLDGVIMTPEAMQIIVNNLPEKQRHWGRMLLVSIVAHDKSKKDKDIPKRKRHSLTESFIKGGAYDSFATKYFSYPKEGEIKHNNRKIIEVKKLATDAKGNIVPKGNILGADGMMIKKKEENNERNKG